MHVDEEGNRPTTTEKKLETHFVFATGAKRSELKPRYDLIPKIALLRLADRFAMGDLKYPAVDGVPNYEKGLPLDDTLNHIIDHLLIYRDKMKALRRALQLEKTELAAITVTQCQARLAEDDDLAGALWGCVALMRLEELGKLL